MRLICKTFKLSRAAYYQAKRGAGEKIVPIERKRKERASSVGTEDLKARIRELVDKYPAWGVRKIWAMLRRDGLRVGQRRVWALMKAMGLTLAPERERGEEPRRGQVATPEPNRRLGTDLTTVYTRKDGLVAIVPVIDCGCRSVLALSATKRQDSRSVLAPVRQALVRAFRDVGQVPMGLELRTDHGPQYTGTDCADLCREWGIDHTFAPVGRPTGNAVTERFIRTLKEELIWLQDWDSLEELQAALDEYRRHYNGVRPHQALAYQTPDEFRTSKLGDRKEAVAA
ncbi:IS2 transposase TnpB [compost metagenome]